MNSKNLLQEYCQKNKLQLPKYETNSIGIYDNNHWWQTTVSISGINFKIVGEVFVRKIDAEMSGASIFYNLLLENEKKDKEYNPSSDIRIYCLVDLESIQQCKDIIFSSNWYVIGVMSDMCPLYSKLEDIRKRMFVNVIKSSVKDAADHYLTFLCAKIPENMKDKTILIVSKDHYASCLPTILNYDGFNDVRHIKSIEELKTFM